MRISALLPVFAALTAVANAAALARGVYTIHSEGDGKRPIGRSYREDRSLLPKRVLVLAEDEDEAPTWDIDILPNGQYRLRARGAPVGDIDSRLFACLIPDRCEGSLDWVITPAFQRGPNVFMVEKPNRSAGWVVPRDNSDGLNKQVEVRPLINGPHGPPEQLFTFTPLE
ncbi:uncharacterized protein BP5553_08861 [Venustampulla echinocandica]|uniref:Uncharacterized protein n=1 Tax=Venustampulla echinocandica TaxID=2656787 RepID=A0A370TD82_9HELO|nr:uncharacterized protein BP5553_08861 [Venustampulla echinocandica]RDL32405.1 hypothetical protein BP5553_08861 [Venustampulla echinocandica]